MAAATESDTPFYLRGAHAPVKDEVEAFDLPVRGALPPELDGHFLRNGPNPPAGDPGHWFLGDGMLHGVELRDGQRPLLSKPLCPDPGTARGEMARSRQGLRLHRRCRQHACHRTCRSNPDPRGERVALGGQPRPRDPRLLRLRGPTRFADDGASEDLPRHGRAPLLRLPRGASLPDLPSRERRRRARREPPHRNPAARSWPTILRSQIRS